VTGRKSQTPTLSQKAQEGGGCHNQRVSSPPRAVGGKVIHNSDVPSPLEPQTRLLDEGYAVERCEALSIAERALGLHDHGAVGLNKKSPISRRTPTALCTSRARLPPAGETPRAARTVLNCSRRRTYRRGRKHWCCPHRGYYLFFMKVLWRLLPAKIRARIPYDRQEAIESKGDIKSFWDLRKLVLRTPS